jgi:LemA protein
MDVYLKKRWDLIPNIVETVKAYANYEKETLEKVIELRNNNYDNMSDNEKIEKNKELTKSINKIIALAESYPNLKANENFLSLNDQLSKIEDEIAESRKYYNAVVRNYNNKVEMIPSNIVASIMKFKTKEMYEIDSNKKNNVKVEI